MKTTRMAQRSAQLRALALLLVVACAGTTLHGDIWLPAKTAKYYSANRKYRVDVTPRKVESQLKYFDDKVQGMEPAGTAAGAQPVGPRASFRVRQFLWYRERCTFPLVNSVAPVDVAVSDRGDYVVTLDDWHGMGYGDSVVVIYRSDGRIVRALPTR